MRPFLEPCVLALAAAAAAQQPRTPDAPTGQVVDASGAGVAGARVRVELAKSVRTACRDHALQVMRRWPLADVTADAEGRFALDLTPAHRRLGTGLEPPLALAIEAPGLQTWYEPLPFGLAGFSGTRAALRPLAADATCTVEVEAPPPGALLWVHRLDAPEGLTESRVSAVPETGRVAVPAPLVPTPLVFDDWRRTRALGHEVHVWIPGRSAAARLDGHVRELRFAAADTATRRLRVLADGEPARGLSGLYACPDGEQRWLPLPDGEAAEDGELRLLALAATGRATAVVSGSLEPVVLAPIVHREVSLAVLGHDGAPARGARVLLVPMTTWPATDASLDGAEVLAADEEARVRVDLARLQQNAVCAVAPGCWPTTRPPHDDVVPPPPLRLAQAPAGASMLTVSDAAGRPVAGAEVRIVGNLPPASLAARAFTSDGAGTCLVPACAFEQAKVVCVGDEGYRQADLREPAPDMAAGAPGRQRARGVASGVPRSTPIAIAGRTLRARVVTAGGQPAAFLAVTIESVTADGEKRTRHGCTDAFGRVRATYVGESATISAGGVSVEQDGRPHDDAEVELVVPEQRAVVVALPEKARVQRVTFWTNDGGVRHENLGVDTDRLALAWREGCRRCDVHLRDGPPVTVTAADVAAARGSPPVVVRDRIVRTVRVHAFDPEQRPVTGFEVRPAFGNSRLLVYDQRESNGGEPGVWTARDDAAHDVQVFHPDFLPSEPVTMAAEQPGRDPAMIVPLQPGARVRFHLAAKVRAQAGDTWTLTIEDGGRPRYHVTLTVRDADAELQLPFALPSGDYAFTLRGRRATRGTFTVSGTNPVDPHVGA